MSTKLRADLVDMLSSRSSNIHQRRITNASNSKDLQDYITRAELIRGILPSIGEEDAKLALLWIETIFGGVISAASIIPLNPAAPDETYFGPFKYTRIPVITGADLVATYSGQIAFRNDTNELQVSNSSLATKKVTLT